MPLPVLTMPSRSRLGLIDNPAPQALEDNTEYAVELMVGFAGAGFVSVLPLLNVSLKKTVAQLTLGVATKQAASVKVR